MGRPPLGKVAMSDAERHRRYMTRLRQRAAAPPPAAAAPTPPPYAPDTMPRIRHLAMDLRAVRFLCQELDKLGAVQFFVDAFNEARLEIARPRDTD